MGARTPSPAPFPTPSSGDRNDKFSHPQFPIYLVTRLAAYDFDEVKGMIDRSLLAVNRGKFVIDLVGRRESRRRRPGSRTRLLCCPRIEWCWTRPPAFSTTKPT